MSRFQSDPTVRLALLSMQAAGTGLTLTAATTVVFAELDWTPTQLQQCEDRVHRVSAGGRGCCVASVPCAVHSNLQHGELPSLPVCLSYPLHPAAPRCQVGQTERCRILYCVAPESADAIIWGTLVKKMHVVGAAVDGGASLGGAGLSQLQYWHDVASQQDSGSQQQSGAAAAAAAAGGGSAAKWPWGDGDAAAHGNGGQASGHEQHGARRSLLAEFVATGHVPAGGRGEPAAAAAAAGVVGSAPPGAAGAAGSTPSQSQQQQLAGADDDDDVDEQAWEALAEIEASLSALQSQPGSSQPSGPTAAASAGSQQQCSGAAAAVPQSGGAGGGDGGGEAVGSAPGPGSHQGSGPSPPAEQQAKRQRQG